MLGPQLVALSFWLLAPYIAIEAIRDLAGITRPAPRRWASRLRHRAW